MAKKNRTAAASSLSNRPAQVRCAIYVRVSNDEKKLAADGLLRGRKEEHSLKMQEEQCRSEAELRRAEGYMVVEVFSDDGYSAKDQKRPALQRMLRGIDAGQIDVVIVYKIDRLTRSVADFYDMTRSWFEREVKFISASQRFDTTTIGGRLMLNILLTFAQFEREIIAERTRHTTWMNISGGKWTGGVVPFGFRLEAGDLAVVEDVVAIVRRIFDEAASGKSAGEIAAGLRADGIRRPTKRYPEGRHWDANSIRSVITNGRYRGVREFNDQEFPTSHPAIVQKDLWDLANARLPESAPAIRQLAKHDYAFVGIGTCGICGQPLAAYPAQGRTRPYHFYTCRRARKRLGGASCALGHIRVDHLERLVIEALGVLGKHPQLVQATLDAASLQKSPEALKRQANLQTLETRLAEVVVERKRLEEIVLDPKRAALSEHMLDRLDAKLVEERRLKEEKHVLELTLQHEEAKALDREMVAKALESLSRVVEALPDTQRRELLHLLIGRLVIKPWEGESTGIQDGAIAIAPEIGTRRYSVKISLSESSLLSTKFTNSVDDSTFEKIGCPGWDRTSDQVINSHLLCH